MRFEEFDEFVTQYSRDLSLTGMFVRTSQPHPPGSSFEFEFEVEGGQRLIRGFGEVVWARRPGDSEQQPPGMGIRFISLDEHSRRLIHWLIDHGLSPAGSATDLRPTSPGSA